MVTTEDELICKAIDEMKRLKIVYRGGGERIIEPHAYGYDRKGERKLRAYQVSGYSESGGSEGWKMFIVSYITEFKLGDDKFGGPREEYNPQGDEMIPHIICML